MKGCWVKNCPLGHQKELILCFIPRCKREIHWQCYVHIVLKGQRKGSEQKEHFWPGNLDVATCARPHLVKAVSLVKRVTVDENLGRLEDDLKGPDDPNNSESMLLDWLTTHGNYETYRGGHGGLTKLQVCAKIANMINLKGVKKERTAEHIYKKIIRFEKIYRKTLDWTNCTGQGVKEPDPQSYEDTVIKRCPHFYAALAPIMGERANAQCIVNSDILPLKSPASSCCGVNAKPNSVPSIKATTLGI
jgi:hypothetical protein